jgi:hypothetical protein
MRLTPRTLLPRPNATATQLPPHTYTHRLWLNGGPGCSSFDGWVYEQGPVKLDFSRESNKVTLRDNPFRWNKVCTDRVQQREAAGRGRLRAHACECGMSTTLPSAAVCTLRGSCTTASNMSLIKQVCAPCCPLKVANMIFLDSPSRECLCMHPTAAAHMC